VEVLATPRYLEGRKLCDRSMLHSSVTCLRVFDVWVTITFVPARTVRGPISLPARYRPQPRWLPRFWGSRYLPVKMVYAAFALLVTSLHVLNDLPAAAERACLTTTNSCSLRGGHYGMRYPGVVPMLRWGTFTDPAPAAAWANDFSARAT
jgi:hypothetical protein